MYRSACIIAFACFIFSGLLVLPSSAQSECLRVALHGQSLGKANSVKGALEKAVKILRKKYSAFPDDISCRVAFKVCAVAKIGNGRFQERMVDKRSYMRLGRVADADIHVVDSIDKCPGFKGSPRACTQYGKYVVISKGYLHGLTIAHDLGHRYTLSWRTDNRKHTLRAAAFMRDGALRLPATVSEEECKYLGGVP